MIPPFLPVNIRMSNYRTGGGTNGNKPTQTIKQLKSAVPGIQKVMNWEPADGGADAEAVPELLERGPRVIRHGGRAVTPEDYEDLAMVASREVARAKCVPLHDLANDPDAAHLKPGVVSLIVVPHSMDTRPSPGSELLNRVRSFLDIRRTPTAHLVLVGPEYIRIDVEVEIGVGDPDTASEVELRVKRALDHYLHPVTGGRDNAGWNFGRHPHRSYLFELIENIEGVSHVRELRMHMVADRAGAEKTGRSLVCCGTHTITTILEE